MPKYCIALLSTALESEQVRISNSLNNVD